MKWGFRYQLYYNSLSVYCSWRITRRITNLVSLSVWFKPFYDSLLLDYFQCNVQKQLQFRMILTGYQLFNKLTLTFRHCTVKCRSVYFFVFKTNANFWWLNGNVIHLSNVIFNCELEEDFSQFVNRQVLRTL